MSRFQSTIVVSRDGTAAGNRREFEEALAGALRAGGNEAWMIPHLYHLRSSHPAARRLSREAEGGLVVASWLPPRAAFWTLRALGVSGAPEADAATGPGLQNFAEASGARTVCCADLGRFASVEACAAALRDAAARLGDSSAGTGASSPADLTPAEAKEIAEPAEARWFPVIDYSLCANCGACVEFCLFGVYSARDGRVAVTSPDLCKNGCPACARTCPRGAILFPHYFADPAIAGAAPPAPDAAERAKRGAPGIPPRRREEQDPLDRLIGTLEKLDG